MNEPHSVISSNSPILDNIPAVAVAMWEHAGRRGCFKGKKAQEIKRMDANKTTTKKIKEAEVDDIRPINYSSGDNIPRCKKKETANITNV